MWQFLMQIWQTRIDWLAWILVGVCIDELIRAAIALANWKPQPFHQPEARPRRDPQATLPIKVIRLEETPIDHPDEWDRQQGRFW